MRRYLRLIMGGLFFLGQHWTAYAGEGAFEFFEEEAVENRKVSIASKTDTSLRETPGIVTVITREEVLNSGSRDLMDILTLLVPGFNFANDVEGVVSNHVRGIWAEEGKMLLLVDGLEMNERVFGTTQFGNHFNVDNIERIEIIRGPGSAIYGGFAELAVVNVITKGAEQNGAYVAATNSQMSKTFSHRGVSAGYGKKVGDFSSSLTGTFNRGYRSQEDITDFNGDKRRLSNQLNLADANLSLGYKGLSFRGIANAYHTTEIDLFGSNYTDGELDETFDTYVTELKYDHAMGDGLTVTPRLEYKQDQPWVVNVPDQGYTNHKHAERTTAGLSALWNASEKTSVLGGFEYSRSDVVRQKNAGPLEEMFRNGKNRISSDQYAGYAQFMVQSDIANLTLGSRYDHSDDFGGAFVPRVALTKVLDRLHMKAMASQSFRAPVGILTNRTVAGDDLDAETATNYEVEAGYRFASWLWFVVNGFDVRIKDPIVYGTDPVTLTGVYRNFGKIGTHGVESEVRARGKIFDLTANYAYYDVTTNNVANYAVPTRKNVLIGAPQHRLNAIAGIKFNSRMSLHPSMSYFSKSYGFLRSGEGVGTVDAFTLCNVNLRTKDIAFQGLELDLGVRDIFNQGYDFPPGYNSSKGTLPGLSRAYVVKLAYAHKFQ